jgi:hypothetical protein
MKAIIAKGLAHLREWLTSLYTWWTTTSHVDRYCVICRDTTPHSPERGCLTCDWADRL